MSSWLRPSLPPPVGPGPAHPASGPAPPVAHAEAPPTPPPSRPSRPHRAVAPPILPRHCCRHARRSPSRGRGSQLRGQYDRRPHPFPRLSGGLVSGHLVALPWPRVAPGLGVPSLCLLPSVLPAAQPLPAPAPARAPQRRSLAPRRPLDPVSRPGPRRGRTGSGGKRGEGNGIGSPQVSGTPGRCRGGFVLPV